MSKGSNIVPVVTMTDVNYSGHRRTVAFVAGVTLSGNPFVSDRPTVILENRVNGRVRSVTVLTDDTNRGKAVARLRGESARY